jgi:formylglycine-generating enzyme required for sulfatase activity
MDKRLRSVSASIAAVLLAGTAIAAGPPSGPLKKCPVDSVVSGTLCMDKYEASVWRIPNPTGVNKKLVSKVQKGKATLADLQAAGATQLGTASDDYAPCTDNGQTGCSDIFAVSLPLVTPARNITWFQAQQACKNSRKRLPSNAEWQAAVAGTPDPGPDNGTTDCNTGNTSAVALTGSRSSCVSTDGAFDMVGNLYEWVADWVPLSTACPNWGSFSDDSMCLSGASTTTGPGALVRGGGFASGTAAGPLAVLGLGQPSSSDSSLGFRCAR